MNVSNYMKKNIDILILEDNPYDAELIEKHLQKSEYNFSITHISKKRDFIEYIDHSIPDVILSDYNLVEFTGIDALNIAKDKHPLIPWIIVTGTLNEETAAETIKSGAWDYVVKERLVRLVPAITNALKLKEERNKIAAAENKLKILSKAIDNASSSIIITDLDGFIEYVNPKFSEYTGYSYKEVAGKNTRILKSGKHTIEFYKELWDTILQGKEWRGEILNKRKNGEEYWEYSSIACVKNSKGVIIRFIAIKEDVTEKKKAELELIKAKEKAEESDRLKSSFLANISHEIRTPMNGILGFTNLLINDTTNNSGKKKLFADVIKSSTERLLRLLNNIIDFSKIEAGQINLNYEDFDIIQLLNDLINDAQVSGGPKMDKLKIRFINFEDEDNKLVVSDKNRVQQVILNLLNNAIKYTREGYIDISFKILHNNKIRIGIKDTGIGIAKEKQESIFEKFRQEDETVARDFEGAGLGLSISKAIVEALGGNIFVQSEKGKGSEFYFYIPYMPHIEKNTEPTIEYFDGSITHNKSILIVEDEIPNRLFFEEVFSSLKNDIGYAIDGTDAINSYKKNNYDIVLMDIRLPDMNGIDVVKKIREINPNVKIIAQTAYAINGDEQYFLDNGCDDYIAKPIEMDLLFKKINALT